MDFVFPTPQVNTVRWIPDLVETALSKRMCPITFGFPVRRSETDSVSVRRSFLRRPQVVATAKDSVSLRRSLLYKPFPFAGGKRSPPQETQGIQRKTLFCFLFLRRPKHQLRPPKEAPQEAIAEASTPSSLGSCAIDIVESVGILC